MKVVLFCGGLGLRLREYSEAIPKPMVTIGFRPILWHIMKYYAHFGHKDFILCLGWRGDVIKKYFLNYDECLSNDFVLAGGGRHVDLLNSDIDDWNVTFVDTGITSNIGERLMAVRHHLQGEKTFLANYSDDLTDMHLPDLIKLHHQQEAVATFLSVRPQQSFHTVNLTAEGGVESVKLISESNIWMNGGYFVLNQEVFEYMNEGEDLVSEPFKRLIVEKRLASMKHKGFWGCMDTFKEKQALDDMNSRGETPWEFWKKPCRSVESKKKQLKPNTGGNGVGKLSMPR